MISPFTEIASPSAANAPDAVSAPAPSNVDMKVLMHPPVVLQSPLYEECAGSNCQINPTLTLFTILFGNQHRPYMWEVGLS